MLRLPIIVLLVAVAARLVDRLAPRGGAPRDAPPAPSRGDVVLLIACGARDAWREAVEHAVARAEEPRRVRVHVMVECASLADATANEHVDAHLRPLVRVDHVTMPPSACPLSRLHRMARRAACGDGGRAVYVDVDARLESGWDGTLLDLAARAPAGTVISAPSASRSQTAKYPTLRADGDGGVRRGADRRFVADAPVGMVESVCVCSELCALDGSALRACAVKRYESPVALTDELAAAGHKIVVPTAPLVARGAARLHAKATAHDRGCARALHTNERVGLTPGALDVERIAKFGSCRQAKLALKFR